MLMREKGVFIFGVTMVLLALGLLLAGCGEGNPEETEGGNVSLVISMPGPSADGKNGAVMPDLAVILSKVTVDFVDNDHNGLFKGSEEFFLADTIALSLPRGSYDFTVTGNTENGTPIATSSLKTVWVDKNNKNVSVFIGPIADAVPGYFSWNITLPKGDDLTFKGVTLRNLNDTEEAKQVGTSLISSFTTSVSPSGSYEVVAKVEDSNGDSSRSYATVVHIYAGQTTTMTLGADCFIPKRRDNISVNLNNTALTQNGDVLTASAIFESAQWFIDNVQQEEDAAGVEGHVFDWKTVSDASSYDVGSWHDVRFLGKAGDIWLSQTVSFERKQPQWSAYYVDASGGRDQNDGSTARPFKTLSRAVSVGFEGSAFDSRTIRIVGDNAYKIDGSRAEMATFDGGANTDGTAKTTIIRSGNAGDSVIEVSDGSVVTFKDITISGWNDDTGLGRGLLVTGAQTSVTLAAGTTVTGKATGNLRGGGVLVEDGATLTMKNGSAVTDSSAANGGGVAVTLGTFNMEGGDISCNEVKGDNSDGKGGGVYIGSGGTFTMGGGKISGNEALDQNGKGGGVYVDSGGIFTMTGGTVYGKNADDGENTATSGSSLYLVGNATVNNENGKTGAIEDDLASVAP
jgi:hypothetical protein